MQTGSFFQKLLPFALYAVMYLYHSFRFKDKRSRCEEILNYINETQHNFTIKTSVSLPSSQG
jgi:hypothetical protein